MSHEYNLRIMILRLVQYSSSRICRLGQMDCVSGVPESPYPIPHQTKSKQQNQSTFKFLEQIF